MLLWLNGMTNVQTKHPIDLKMEEFINSKDPQFLPLLLDDEFFVQSKNLNSKVLEFINKHSAIIAKQLVEIVVIDITVVNEDNYEQLAVFPLLAIEFFELDLPCLTEQLLNQDGLMLRIFHQLRNDPPIPEPQWANIYRIFQLILTKDATKLSSILVETTDGKFTLLLHFLNHLSSATINLMLIAVFNSENQVGKDYSEQKYQFICLGFKGFDKMEETALLNFTFLIHEIMTRHFAQDQLQKVMSYLISKEVMNILFNILKSSDGNIILKKSAAHILSLISNYYSYSMQNITIDDKSIETQQGLGEQSYHQQLTDQFESSDFMVSFLPNLHIFSDSFNQVLEVTSKPPLTTVRLKYLEIVDNLVRISNLKLWQELSKLGIIRQIIDIYFKYHSSNIFQSVAEKLIMYVFNRAISDFHPFWTLELLLTINIYERIADCLLNNKVPLIQGPLNLLANHLNWFQSELTEKIVIDGTSAKYIVCLKKIEREILLNDNWRKAQGILFKSNEKCRIQLGSMNDEPASTESAIIVTLRNDGEDECSVPTQPQQTIFMKVKQAQGNPSSVDGDEPAEYEISPEKDDQPISEIRDIIGDGSISPEGVNIDSKIPLPNQEEEEYQYQPVKEIQGSPNKESNEKIQQYLITQKSGSEQFDDPNFETPPFTDSSNKQTKLNGNTTPPQKSVSDPKSDKGSDRGSDKHSSKHSSRTASPHNSIGNPVSPKSFSLQDYVTPIATPKITNYYQLLASPQPPTKNEEVSKIDIEAQKIDTEPKVTEQFSDSSPNNKIDDIIKKYSNLSKSQRLGQADELPDNDAMNQLSMSRKQSMESSLRLKQLESESSDEQFKIISKSTHYDDDDKIIIQPSNKRVLVVDELDVLVVKKQQEQDSLLNNSFNLGNMSFDSSKSGKRRKVIFKQLGGTRGSEYKNNDQNKNKDKEKNQPEEQFQFKITNNNQHNSSDILNMSDSYISNSESNIEEKKFRKMQNKDKKFLKFIQNK